MSFESGSEKEFLNILLLFDAVLGSIAWFSVYYREKRERFEDQVIVGS